MEMLAGGALLLLAGLVTGEWKSFNLEALSLRSIISLGYLIVFGSLLGFTAYIWLLGVRTPAKVSTYAYVNPVVAIFIGWAIGGEALTARTLLAAAIIVTAVVVITTQRGRRSTQKDERTSADRKILARPDAKIKIRRIPQLLDEDRI
jgi:drug/metabolite transporter (DMT)-like permease